MLRSLFARRLAGKWLPSVESLALTLEEMEPDTLARRHEPRISPEEWQARSERAARERAEEKELSRAQQIRRGSQYRQIYEQAHGPIPEGYHVHHKDGNHENNHADNLEAIKPRVHRMKHELMGQRLPVIYQYPSEKHPEGRSAPH